MKYLAILSALLLAACMTVTPPEGAYIEFGSRGSIHGYGFSRIAENGVMVREIGEFHVSHAPRFERQKLAPGAFDRAIGEYLAHADELTQIVAFHAKDEPCVDYGLDFVRAPELRLDHSLSCPDTRFLEIQNEIETAALHGASE